jgi:hypothetical protein
LAGEPPVDCPAACGDELRNEAGTDRSFVADQNGNRSKEAAGPNALGAPIDNVSELTAELVRRAGGNRDFLSAVHFSDPRPSIVLIDYDRTILIRGR